MQVSYPVDRPDGSTVRVDARSTQYDPPSSAVAVVLPHQPGDQVCRLAPIGTTALDGADWSTTATTLDGESQTFRDGAQNQAIPWLLDKAGY